MPFAMCPTCGSIGHLNVSDPDWYQKYYPEVPVGEVVPGSCFFCFVTLRAGDRVLTRRWGSGSIAVEPDQPGTLTAIRTDQEGQCIYVVLLESGKTIVLPRGALRKLSEQTPGT